MFVPLSQVPWGDDGEMLKVSRVEVEQGIALPPQQVLFGSHGWGSPVLTPIQEAGLKGDGRAPHGSVWPVWGHCLDMERIMYACVYLPLADFHHKACKHYLSRQSALS